MPGTTMDILIGLGTIDTSISDTRPIWLEFLREVVPDKSERNLSYFIVLSLFVFYGARSLLGDDSKSVKRGLFWVIAIVIVSAAVKIFYLMW